MIQPSTDRTAVARSLVCISAGPDAGSAAVAPEVEAEACPARGGERDGEREGERERPARLGVEEPDGVHAHHDQLRVAEPDHVHDAEHQVQPEHGQGEHAAEQDAVDDRFEQERIKHGRLISVSSSSGV